MKTIRTEIQIAAPISDVWKVLVDFNNWTDWNPMINKISGSAIEGTKLSITMCGKGDKDGPKYEPLVVEVNPPNCFRWKAKMMAGIMMTNYRVFELKEKEGGTLFVNSELFSGLMIMMAGKKLDQFVPSMLEQMNKALKEKME